MGSPWSGREARDRALLWKSFFLRAVWQQQQRTIGLAWLFAPSWTLWGSAQLGLGWGVLLGCDLGIELSS